jgi:hypothetical protein
MRTYWPKYGEKIDKAGTLQRKRTEKRYLGEKSEEIENLDQEDQEKKDYGAIERADDFYGKKGANRLPTGSKRLKAKKSRLRKI